MSTDEYGRLDGKCGPFVPDDDCLRCDQCMSLTRAHCGLIRLHERKQTHV